MNLKEIESKFGSEVAELVKKQIDMYRRFGREYSVEVVDECGFFATIIVADSISAFINEYHKGSNSILRTVQVKDSECEAALKIMDRIWDVEHQCS